MIKIKTFYEKLADMDEKVNAFLKSLVENNYQFLDIKQSIDPDYEVANTYVAITVIYSVKKEGGKNK